MINHPSISSFVKFAQDEAFEREYFIAHSTLKRFPAGVILMILGGLVFIVPGLILLVYFSVRRLKISRGYAAVTNKRVLYYEYNDHPAVNYQHVRSLHVDQVTGMDFRVQRTFWKKSFYMVLYTEQAGIQVGARSYINLLKSLGSQHQLEPGPESLEFIQVMSGRVSASKFSPTSGSGAGVPGGAYPKPDRSEPLRR
jgi:hypothetical protein